mgnify:CR=1 FL=1
MKYNDTSASDNGSAGQDRGTTQEVADERPVNDQVVNLNKSIY